MGLAAAGRLPEPADTDEDEHAMQEMGRQFARERVSAHDDRPNRPVVLLGPSPSAAANG